MKQVRFDYMTSEGRILRDGVLTRMIGGVHISLWGGENTYWFSTMGSQSGKFTALLVSSVVDSDDIPVKKWDVRHTFDQDGLLKYRTYFAKVCREAAEIIGKDLSEESRAAIAEQLLAHREMDL